VAGADIDDRSAPSLGTPPALPAEQRLVQPERFDLADAGGILHQRRAVRDHGVVHGVPVIAKLAGDLGDGAAEPAHLVAHPAASPVSHRPARRRDRRTTGPGWLSWTIPTTGLIAVDLHLCEFPLVEVMGFEPTTSSMRPKRSSQLSYTPEREGSG
jgi:hypothetical protein